MSGFAVDGLVSGLDTTKLVSQLMQLERIPQQRLQATLRNQTSSVTAYQGIATRLKAVETAAAALTRALAPHGTGAYARVLVSGQVSAGLTPLAAQGVITVLTARASSRSRRRGLGRGYAGTTTR